MTNLVTIPGGKAQPASRRAELFAQLAQEDAQTFHRVLVTGQALLAALDDLEQATTQKNGVREKGSKLRDYVAGELATMQALEQRR